MLSLHGTRAHRLITRTYGRSYSPPSALTLPAVLPAALDRVSARQANLPALQIPTLLRRVIAGCAGAAEGPKPPTRAAVE